MVNQRAGGPRSSHLGDLPVAVSFADVVCLIDQFPALAGVNLEIREGAVVLLRGPNGAGKSTLLRLCAGLLAPASGTGHVLGHDVSDPAGRRELRRDTGLLAHETFLYDQLTVEENVRFWSTANRADPSTVEPALDRLGIGGRLRSVKAGALSAGQRRRTAIAIMVSRRPRLWLLDEPHGGLDQNGRQVIDDLLGHAIGFGATVIVASHDETGLTRTATKTVTIVGGQVVPTRPEDTAVRRSS